MILRQERSSPESWNSYRQRFPSRWLTPFYAFEWLLDWTAFFLSRWALIEVLEYLGTFSILIAVVFYFAESGDRIKQKHYQAWQVINTAQGKGGSGGRIEAVEELNADRVPLVGIDLEDAFLYGLKLDRADLMRSNFGSADLRESSFESADLADSSFNTANLRGSNLRRANLSHSDFQDADLTGADLSGANASGARFDNANLRYADLNALNWRSMASIRLANLYGAKHLPSGFADWARQHGAVFNNTGE